MLMAEDNLESVHLNAQLHRILQYSPMAQESEPHAHMPYKFHFRLKTSTLRVAQL